MFISLQLCVRAMASLETIGPLMNGMKKRSDVVGIACETLNRMFQKEQTDLVAQVSSTFSDCKNVVYLNCSTPEHLTNVLFLLENFFIWNADLFKDVTWTLKLNAQGSVVSSEKA